MKTQTLARSIQPEFNLPAVDLDRNIEIHIPVKEFVPVQQPEQLKDDFFNSIITTEDGRKYLVSSIDLEFK